MARGLESLSNETLFLILGQFCLHCSRACNYDSPDGHFRRSRPQSGPQGQDQDQDFDEPAWYSRNFRKTLHSMCLVSRRFLPLAQTVLYHEFVPGYGDDWRSTQFSWDGRLASFVRTLAARPDLAALVKRVFIHCYLLRAVTEKEAEDVSYEVLGTTACRYLTEFETLVQYSALTREERRIAALEILGILLALLPNLERLGLQTDQPKQGAIPTRALSTLASLLKSRLLVKLNTLDICGLSSPFSLCYPASGILDAVASTSSFTTLNLHMCDDTTQARPPQRARLQNISAIQITWSRLSTGDLASLFDTYTAPTLKSFVYKAAYPWLDRHRWSLPQPYSGIDHFTGSDAIRHLRQHKRTLESLHLDLRGANLGWVGVAPPLSETLRDFTTLRCVFLTASMLYSDRGRAPYASDDSMLLTSLLPTTITSLFLIGDLGRFVPPHAQALLHLAQSAGPQQFTALRRVRCDTVQADGLAGFAIREAFAAGGVDFGYDDFPRSGPIICERVGTLVLDDGVPLPDDDDDL